MSLLFSIGHPWPICLPWASSTFLLTLYSLGLLLTLLGFPSPIISYSSFGFMGLPSIPYSLCLHCFEPATAHSYFFSHHTLPLGLLFAISLFLGSFEPICFLKAHLFISWTCDPLFLLLGLNGFCSLYFADFFLVCVAGWASSLSFGFHKKKTLNNGLMVRTRANVTSIMHSNPPLHTSKLPIVSVIVVKMWIVSWIDF